MEQKLSATPAPGSLASTPEASAKIAGEAPALTEPHKLPSLRALTARCREAAANKACDIGVAWNLIEEAADALDAFGPGSRPLRGSSRFASRPVGFDPYRKERPVRIWFDTEFIEDGKTIDLISIGLVREDGEELYFESADCDLTKASPWVKENVLSRLTGNTTSRTHIAREIKVFAGNAPEFWAYYADYDWVALCQLYGTMMDLPKGWPMFCRDVKQLCWSLGDPQLPKQDGEHNALADARWTRAAFQFLGNYAPAQGIEARQGGDAVAAPSLDESPVAGGDAP